MLLRPFLSSLFVAYRFEGRHSIQVTGFRWLTLSVRTLQETGLAVTRRAGTHTPQPTEETASYRTSLPSQGTPSASWSTRAACGSSTRAQTFVTSPMRHTVRRSCGSQGGSHSRY